VLDGQCSALTKGFIAPARPPCMQNDVVYLTHTSTQHNQSRFTTRMKLSLEGTERGDSNPRLIEVQDPTC
jgi:hypothetical protein